MDTTPNSPISPINDAPGMIPEPPMISRTDIPPVPPTPTDEPYKSKRGIIIGSAAGAAALAAAGAIFAWKHASTDGPDVEFEEGEVVADNSQPPVPEATQEQRVVHHHVHHHTDIHNQTVKVVPDPQAGTVPAPTPGPTPAPTVETPVEDYAVFVNDNGICGEVAYIHLEDGTHAFIFDYDGDGIADLAVVDPTGTDTFEQTAFEWFDDVEIPMINLANDFYQQTGINPYEEPLPEEVYIEFANMILENNVENNVATMGIDEDGDATDDDADEIIAQEDDDDNGVHTFGDMPNIPAGMEEEEIYVDPFDVNNMEDPSESIIGEVDTDEVYEPVIEEPIVAETETETEIDIDPEPDPITEPEAYEPEPEPEVYEPEPEPEVYEPEPEVFGSEPEPFEADSYETDLGLDNDNIDL